MLFIDTHISLIGCRLFTLLPPCPLFMMFRRCLLRRCRRNGVTTIDVFSPPLTTTFSLAVPPFFFYFFAQTPAIAPFSSSLIFH